MTPTELQSERDRLAENAGHECFSRHMNETIAGPSSLFEHGFAAGFDACLKLMLERERVLRDGLKFYAQNQHFEFCGKQENEPEVAEDEYPNWECGGPDDHEYQYENGLVAQKRLTRQNKNSIISPCLTL